MILAAHAPVGAVGGDVCIGGGDRLVDEVCRRGRFALALLVICAIDDVCRIRTNLGEVRTYCAGGYTFDRVAGNAALLQEYGLAGFLLGRQWNGSCLSNLPFAGLGFLHCAGGIGRLAPVLDEQRDVGDLVIAQVTAVGLAKGRMNDVPYAGTLQRNAGCRDRANIRIQGARPANVLQALALLNFQAVLYLAQEIDAAQFGALTIDTFAVRAMAARALFGINLCAGLDCARGVFSVLLAQRMCQVRKAHQQTGAQEPHDAEHAHNHAQRDAWFKGDDPLDDAHSQYLITLPAVFCRR